jgi:light-regulated signal transduction histidine kinase (bacteriophytochrome)
VTSYTYVQPPRTTDDLSSCAEEPIHIPGSIQPHGVLFALDIETLAIQQVSANALELLGIDPEQSLGKTLNDVLPSPQSLNARLQQGRLEADVTHLADVPLRSGVFQALAHQHNNRIIVELEPAAGPFADPAPNGQSLVLAIRVAINQMKRLHRLEALASTAADEVRRITGFDRVLVYQFDPNWNGHVIGESRDPEVASYMDLWFPASDIPPQARALYEVNAVRLIMDVDYKPAALVPPLDPLTGASLDLSCSVLRSVSPVHLEYLKNMGLGASMSISILSGEGKLWGLIACHHRKPRIVALQIRTACNLLAQVLSVQIESTVQRAEYEQRISFKSHLTRLLAYMAEESNFINGLTRHADELLALGDADGAAVLFEGHCTLLGKTPSEADVWHIVDWLFSPRRPEVFSTDSLGSLHPDFQSICETASGLLAISISKLHRSYVLWFRPELVHTVKWGGDPNKPVDQHSGRIHPRKSFETWKETVRGHSRPWTSTNVEAAVDLRNSVIGVVLRKAEEVAQISAELQRSNKELEAFSYSVSHDLRAPFRHIVGYSELLKQSQTAELSEKDRRYLDTIIESAHFAGTLVDKLLGFSQVGRARLSIREVDVDHMVRDVIADLQAENPDRRISWQVGQFPSSIRADAFMLRLVWQNLLHNAVKYTRGREETLIQLRCDHLENEWVFSVHDNGVGFEQAYVDKLFGVFQRLHRMEDYEGTGIGLANVRRIVARHGGRTWAEGQVDRGAVFYFTIPFQIRQDSTAHNA